MKVVNKMQRFETQLYQINLKQRDTATGLFFLSQTAILKPFIMRLLF